LRRRLEESAHGNKSLEKKELKVTGETPSGPLLTEGVNFPGMTLYSLVLHLPKGKLTSKELSLQRLGGLPPNRPRVVFVQEGMIRVEWNDPGDERQW